MDEITSLKLTKFEKIFLKIINLVARGEITNIEIDAYDNGIRKATITWIKGKDDKRAQKIKEKALTMKSENGIRFETRWEKDEE